MKLIKDLISSIKEDCPISQIMVGVHWTAVHSHTCGMASTVMSSQPHEEGQINNAGELHLMSAKELSGYAQSDNPLEASVGLACINSLVQIPGKNITTANAFDVIAAQGKGKNVAVFGHFPHMGQVRANAKSLSVFEMSPAEGEFSLEKIPEILPNMQVAAITSNAIINHTLDLILPYLNENVFTLMVGPSTPLSPVLFDYGITMLAGVKVLNPQILFHTISQGAIFRQVGGVELVTIAR